MERAVEMRGEDGAGKFFAMKFCGLKKRVLLFVLAGVASFYS